MKLTRKLDNGSPNCSCTSCLYKSESEQSSIKKYIARGSRIDRLYYGKHIPLHERKLLNRLVRTRAVYDDLRARLLSGSTLSLDKDADLKPRRHRHAIKSLKETEKSGAILELVDFIDKGAPGTTALGPRNLSECCSCCSCSSKVNILESDNKARRYRRTYSRGFEREYDQSGFEEGYGHRVNRMGERYNRRGRRFKAKHIRSEPCTCTLKFSGLIKKHSKALFRKIHPVPPEPYQTTEEQSIIEKSNLQNFARKSYRKYKGLQHKLEQDIKKLNESTVNIKQNFQVHAKKSLEQVKYVKDKLKSNIESGVRNSVQAVKALKPKDNTFESLEYLEYETPFKIKKDSILKFKDYLKRKEMLKDWECDLECAPDTCVPEECFKTIKLRLARKLNRHRDHKYTTEDKMLIRNAKVGRPRLRKSSSSVQAEQFMKTTTSPTKQQKPELRFEGENQVIPQGVVFEMTDSKASTNTQRPLDFKYGPRQKRTKHHRRRSQVIPKTSLEISQYTFKVKPKKRADKITQEKKLGGNITTLPRKQHMSHSKVKVSTDYGMTPSSSLTKKPHVADKQRKVSSLVSLVPLKKVPQKDVLQKEVSQKDVPQKFAVIRSSSPSKQAVRIGSTFSFSVEFSKRNNQNDIKIPFTGGKVKQTRSKSSPAPPKPLKMKGSLVKAKYKDAKMTLNRCFCILKTHKFVTPRKKIKTSTTGTVTSFTNYIKSPSMFDKYVETKKRGRIKLPKQYELLPYECEPGVCTPDECDPILCMKMMDLRNAKGRMQKSKGSYASSRKTKSTSSIVSRSIPSVKAKTVQSSVVPKYKENIRLNQNEPNKRKFSERQAVRIGSSFSFNIELYKDTPGIANKASVSRIPKEVKFREGGHQYHNKNNKSMFVQVNNFDKNIGSPRKKSFWTPKLHKKHDEKKKAIRKMLTTNTQTLGEVLTEKTMSKGTKTKWKYNYELLPFECEPYTCEPGLCDPYLCLEEIKRRNLNYRDYGVFTDKLKMRSVSSFIESPYKRSAAIEVRPKLFVRETNIRDNYIKALDDKPRRVLPHTGGSGETFRYSDSRQTVSIGSSFNFSIEFSKQLPQMIKLKKESKIRQTTKANQKIYHDKGVKVNKIRVGHIDTQSQKPRNVHRSSLVRPILKRCFCTLNLYKKTKQQHYKSHRTPWTSGNNLFEPQIYTVNRAISTKTEFIPFQNLEQAAYLFDPKKKMPSISTSSFLLKNYARSLSKYSTLKLRPVFNIPLKPTQPIKISSNLSVEVEFIRPICPPSLYSIQRSMTSNEYLYNKPQEHTNVFVQPYHQSLEKFIGISQYLERCYCTMNLQISHGRGTGRKHITNQLKPYECEPGICVPGECDPYICQKLIMKRLMRNVHKGSSTETTNKSVSSNVTQSETVSRSTPSKRHVRTHLQDFNQRKHKPQKLRETKKRQAVRMGSSFTFNVDFSKNRSTPIVSPIVERYYKNDQFVRHHKKPVKDNTYYVNTKGAQGFKITGKNRQLQSNTTLVHKGSNYAPKLKRCFCTLKLQKRGKIFEENLKFNKQQPNMTSRSIKVGTGKLKYDNIPAIDAYNLKSYECEPGVCIPGQCNPYQCLEIMKKRKEMGVSASRLGDKSVSSMTSQGKYPKKKLRARAVNVRPKNAYQTMKVKKNVGIAESVNPPISERSSRQAVRIGSNFSFNVEFYKDSPKIPKMNDNIIKVQNIKTADVDASQKRYRKDKSDSYSQSSRDISRRVTQIEKPIKEVSMMAKRQGTNKSTFMHKCFCVLGLRNKLTNNNQSGVNTQSAHKETNTNYRYKVNLPHLDPYECEPGICIPGHCDPYLCNEIIQQRTAKHYSKASGTESVRTQSVSSSYGYIKRPRNERTQARVLKHNQKQYVSKNYPSLPSGKTAQNTNKRMVRIGSNFSFNVEVYKENVNGRENIENPRELKTYPNRNILYKKVTKTNPMKNTMTESMSPTLRSNNTQIDKKQLKSSGVSPLIKRCFCTLKLLNKPIDHANNVSKKVVGPKRLVTKNVETQSHKYLMDQPLQNEIGGDYLSPYECEPFTCIPGECDPVECLDRIKKRQRHTKDFGTFTEHTKKRSVGSFSPSPKRDQNLQAKFINASRNKATHSLARSTNYEETPKIQNYGDNSRQAVRIGSNFSFNIEFFKENSAPDGVTNPIEDLNMKQYSNKPFKKLHKNAESNFSRDADSKVSSVQVRPPDTAMAHLKRCFCTLQLRNKDIKKVGNNYEKTQSHVADVSYPPKAEHSVVDKFLKKFKFNKVGKLQKQPPTPTVKYEIKGTSTYNGSIRKNQIVKPIRILEPYECEPNICIPGECDPYECLKRIQRRQVRDFGTEYKRNVKHSATYSIQERKLHSRGTSFPTKRRRRSTETTQHLSHFSDNINRQAVRIGSNFSFNIEFFKDHGPAQDEYKVHKDFKTEKVPKIKTKPELRARSRGSYYTGPNLQCEGSQCPFLKRQIMSSAVNTVPKRCFCTAKFFNIPNNRKLEAKPLRPLPITEHKMTATKNKYVMPHELGVYECPPLMCIPGECDPYDCLNKLKRRGLYKSRSVGTREGKTSIATVGSRASKLRARKIQAHVIKKGNISTLRSIPQSDIIKSPQITQNVNKQNKHAVRIGSNFNFNIDFFKQQSQPIIIQSPKIVKARNKHEYSKSYLSKTVAAKTGKYEHHDSQADFKTKDQGSDAVNMLKRCFCTLQLQKSTQGRMLKNDMNPLGIKVRYPQTFTVGRVAVEPVNKNVPKNKRSGSVERSRRLTSTAPKLLDNSRSIATKTEKKYLQNKNKSLSQCDPTNCPGYQKKMLFGIGNINDMETILPYTPSKFNKKESKTLMSVKKKVKAISIQNQTKIIEDNKPHGTLFNKSKRLTAKKNKRSLNELGLKSSFNNSFLCRCTNFFSKRTDTTRKIPGKIEIINDLRNYQPPSSKLTTIPKKSKSVKLTKPIVDEKCPCPKNKDNFFFSNFQSGDARSSIKPVTEISDGKQSKNKGTKKSHTGHSKQRVTFADNVKYQNINIEKEKKKKLLHHKSSNRPKLCYSCSANNCPLQCNNIHSDKKISGVLNLFAKSLAENNKKTITHSESADNCQYCDCCKRKIDVGEISKAAGDKLLTFSKYGGTCRCGKIPVSVKENEGITGVGVHKHSIRQKTKKDKTGVDLVKQTIQHKIKEGKTGMDMLKQAIRQKTKPQVQGAKISVSAKGTPNVRGAFGNLFPAKKVVLSKPSNKPCICGSKKCAKASKRKKKSKPWLIKLQRSKPCVCGSPICTRESKKMKPKKQATHICKCRETMVAREAEEIRRQKVIKRLKIEDEKGKKRRKKRMKHNVELEKEVKKAKKSSDVTLAVTSLIDIAKLGVTTVAGALHSAAKAIYDPRFAYEKIKRKKSEFDSKLAMKQLAKDYIESDAAATAKRLKLRFSFMRNVKTAKNKLEGNRFTHYLIHMADKNPKTRRFKAKPVRRRREPLDFQCSLYMASLRRRRCLWVYRKCPMFYPHLITMLNIWKQFTDIMLFLLAVTVWSPCILCMEACRAMTCCFFCTG